MTSRHAGYLSISIIYVFLCHQSAPAQACKSMQSSNSRNFIPEQQSQLAIEDSEISAIIQPQPYPFQIRVLPKSATRDSFTIPVPEELAQIDEICLRKNRIIVRGMVSNALSEVVIFDETNGNRIDAFRGYWPNISAISGRIIFTKEYPIHFADGTEDHYMLYDLNLPPEANHAPGAVPLRNRPAGIPLYPMTAGNQNFDNTNLRGDLHEQLAAGFFWDNEGSEAITLDSFEAQFSLILVQFHANKATIGSLNIEAQSICDTNPHASCPKMLYLARAVFVTGKDGTRSVVATFGRPVDADHFTVAYPLSSFSILGERSTENLRWVR